jgi:hypothetical protein
MLPRPRYAPAAAGAAGVLAGRTSSMSPWDDDDWVGEPPEGRHARDRAKPEFWSRPPLVYGLFFFGLFVLAVVAIVLAL